jgi:glutathione S-transferase
MIGSELYFANAHQRWTDEANFRILLPVMSSYATQMGAPGWLAPTLIRGVRRRMLRQLHAQGMGRHTAEEVAHIAVSGYSAISDFLSDKKFMLGTKPSTLDATVFAFLHTLLVPPFESPAKVFALSRSNLVSYHERILASWWPELKAC